ncbi:flavin reductase family protein [Verticiella sediminum]
MGLLCSGVSAVTTTAENGAPRGIIVSSLTSLSADPTPLLLVCINRSSSLHDDIAARGKFGVSILSEDAHDDSARLCAYQPEKRFDGISFFWGEYRVPLLTHALVNIECSVHEAITRQTHTIFIGGMLSASKQDLDKKPLVYFNKSYRSIAKSIC